MVLRIGGLASGMDIDQIVGDLMKAERVPLDKLNQKKQYMEWQRDDYRDMNKLLFELDQLIFDGVSKQGSYIKKTINTSDSDAVSIRNITSTAEFNGTIEVNQLASSATMRSKASITLDPSQKLIEQGITGSQTITVKAINKAGALESDGYTLTFNPQDETLNSLIEKINKDSGVTAFFDETTKNIAFTAKNTGEINNFANPGDGEIVLEGDFFTNQLNMDTDNRTAESGGFGTTGTNSDFTYNGLRTNRPSNTFQINGVEFTLKQETNSPVTFSSTPDVDSIMDTVVKFVDKYNEVIGKIKGELDEKRYRDYQPLTKEQRDSMEEKEIELWEERAKSGTLRGDSILSSSLNKMRMDLYAPVSGLQGFSQLAEIGITTSSNYMEGGKLTIDPDKLREAITSNPTGIYELFQKDGTETEDKGLARRLRDSIKSTIGEIETKAGKATSINNTFSIGRLLNNLDNQITRFEDRIIQVEDRYWRQFTAMEKAIQRSNEQAMFLMNQFGGGA